MSDEVQLTKYQEAVLSEIISAVGDPGATLDTIGGQLGQIWEDAEKRQDGQALQIIGTAWEYVQLMSQQQGHAMNLAAAARELAELTQQNLVKAQEEMEAVRGDYDDLISAIEIGDESHELLADYAKDIRNEVENDLTEMFQEDALNYAFECVDETIDEALSVFCQQNKMDRLGPNGRQYLIGKIRGEDVWEERQAALWKQIIEIERELQVAHDRQQAEWLNAHNERVAKMRAEEAAKKAAS